MTEFEKYELRRVRALAADTHEECRAVTSKGMDNDVLIKALASAMAALNIIDAQLEVMTK